MTDNTESKTQGPYGRDGETVGVVDSEGEGSITFGSREEYDKPYRDKQWLFYQYKELKKSTTEIAEMSGCSNVTISEWLRKHDIPTRPHGESIRLAVHGSSRPWEDEEWLRDQYVEQRKTMAEIAEEQGASANTIKRALVDAGIQIRNGGRRDRYRLYPKLQDHEWLRHQYIDRERSVKQIADGLGAPSTTVYDELDGSDIELRDYSEANQLRYEKENRVSESEVPKPPSAVEAPPDPQEESTGDMESKTGQRSYEGPETGVDLSWSDSSPGDSDREKWVPYRTEEWLRWQYEDLEKTAYEIADYCGVNPSTIYRHMERFGIERRDSHRHLRDGEAEDGPGGTG